MIDLIDVIDVIGLMTLQILLFGTAVYNGSVITFHDMQYSELTDEEKEEVELSAVIKTEYTMASPSMTRSPLVYQQLRQHNQQEQHGYSSVSNGKSKRPNEV